MLYFGPSSTLGSRIEEGPSSSGLSALAERDGLYHERLLKAFAERHGEELPQTLIEGGRHSCEKRTARIRRNVENDIETRLLRVQIPSPWLTVLVGF